MLISIIIVGKGLIMKVSARILSAHVMGNNEYHWNGVINYKLKRGVTCHPPMSRTGYSQYVYNRMLQIFNTDPIQDMNTEQITL